MPGQQYGLASSFSQQPLDYSNSLGNTNSTGYDFSSWLSKQPRNFSDGSPNYLQSSINNVPSINTNVASGLGDAPGTSGGTTPWYQDSSKLQGYAGLASSAAQLASLPGQLKTAKLQRQGLQENIKQAKIDNNFRATTRNNLSNHTYGGT